MNGILKANHNRYLLKFLENSSVAVKIIRHLPIVGIGYNLGGEIYFRLPDIDIEYDGTQRSLFEPGDITYWRSPDGEKKFSIAIFYGPTPFGENERVQSASPCVKIGKIITDFSDLELLITGESILICRF